MKQLFYINGGMQPAIYILCNKHRNVLYTGVTSNLARRMYEHKNKLIPGFTLKYNVDQLVYYELFELMTDALNREKMIKKKLRRGKIELIESINPDWNDLSTTL